MIMKPVVENTPATNTVAADSGVVDFKNLVIKKV